MNRGSTSAALALAVGLGFTLPTPVQANDGPDITAKSKGKEGVQLGTKTSDPLSPEVTAPFVDHFVCVYPETDEDGNIIYYVDDDHIPVLRAVFELSKMTQLSGMTWDKIIAKRELRYPDSPLKIESDTTFSMDFDGIDNAFWTNDSNIQRLLNYVYLTPGDVITLQILSDQSYQFSHAEDAIAYNLQDKLCPEPNLS